MRRALTAVLLALPLAGAGAAVTAAPAAAAATQTRLTAPADGLRVAVTNDDPATVPVAGTATGGVAGEPLRLACFTRPEVASDVGFATIGDDGQAFSGSAALASVRGSCVLRALPTAFAVPGDDPAPFAGRLVTTESERLVVPGSGGAATGVDDWFQQATAGVGICSLGQTGLCGGRLFDVAGRRATEPVFNAGGWIGVTTGVRSYVQVDGVNAYPPARANQIGAGRPGLLGLTRTVTRPTPDGGVSTVETDPLLACDAAAFPPDATCTRFTDTGARYERTTTVSPDGTTVEQRDALLSADGRAHRVSAYLGENFLLDGSTTPAIGFGWVRGDVPAARTAGTEVGGPTSGPATITVASSSTAPDGDPVYANGAITFDRPPASVRVATATDLLVRFPDLAVPAGGRADLVRSTYVMTRTAGEAKARATALEDRLVPPTIAFTTPKEGATALTPTVTVVGSAADNVGVASVTVSGKPVAVSASGRFTASVPLDKGANTITGAVTDTAGNRTEATLRITYADRTPPLVGPLYLTPRVWRVGRPTTVSFALGESGTLRLTASRVVGGRSQRGTCVAATPALRRARAKVCVRAVRLATLVEPRPAGTASAAVGPKTGGRTLTPGRILLQATVTDYAGNVSKVRTLQTTLRPALPQRP